MSNDPRKAETTTITCLVCPTCGTRGSSIDHLKVGTKFGPWRCHSSECMTEIHGIVTAAGADITTTERERGRLALLKFRDVFFIYESSGTLEHADYFFHSHQCPGNLMRSVISHGVFDATGADPHGLIRYVADIEDTKAQRDRLRGSSTLQELFALFGTDGTPPPSDWAEEDGGMLPFVAEAQREHTKKRSPKA